jgi:hypothetical protein
MTEKKRRLSRLQKVILEQLKLQPNKAIQTSRLIRKVAFEYCPQKILEKDYPFHGFRYKIKDSFYVSYDRAMHSLELKGLVELVHGKPLIREVRENDIFVVKEIIRLYAPNGKVTFIIHHESPFFLKKPETKN